ncbi:MAG: hypothetical protein FWD26_01635 [Treponema sp.]|nr:hypothetical protein [Treponema sp.]
MKTALKKTLFRMWAAGAVCFFAAWGRSGPQDIENAAHAFSLNLVWGLIAIMVIADIVIVNPVIRMASGKRVFGEEKKGLMFVFSLPLHIIKVTAIMAIIVITYYYINVIFIRLFSLDEAAVPVPLEPFLFGFLYGVYYLLLETAYEFVIKKIAGRSHEK